MIGSFPACLAPTPTKSVRPQGQVVDMEFTGISGSHTTQVNQTSLAIAVASMAMEAEQLPVPSVVNSSKNLPRAKHLV